MLEGYPVAGYAALPAWAGPFSHPLGTITLLARIGHAWAGPFSHPRGLARWTTPFWATPLLEPGTIMRRADAGAGKGNGREGRGGSRTRETARAKKKPAPPKRSGRGSTGS